MTPSLSAARRWTCANLARAERVVGVTSVAGLRCLAGHGCRAPLRNQSLAVRLIQGQQRACGAFHSAILAGGGQLVLTERFLKNRRGVLEPRERAVLEQAIAEVRSVPARTTLTRIGDRLSHSTLLLEGFLCRIVDDRKGLRQLVAVHVPGEFVDLHGYPLKTLDHDVASLTAATIAIVPHAALDRITEEMPALTRKLWYATLLDAAIHRAWLFRLGRLDATGRVAHFLSETNARLAAVGLSDGRRFALGISQAELAEICGLTSVHVNRVMRQLREDGLCVFRYAQVDILDSAGLAERGEFDPEYLYLQGPQLAARRRVG
ncbi:Crp/Fnr family transcriptional regulator [Roseomonas hellenica]|nr:Crp/Fnr family transcriptional regulator [Plastoroseomonas hellenica]